MSNMLAVYEKYLTSAPGTAPARDSTAGSFLTTNVLYSKSSEVSSTEGMGLTKPMPKVISMTGGSTCRVELRGSTATMGCPDKESITCFASPQLRESTRHIECSTLCTAACYLNMLSGYHSPRSPFSVAALAPDAQPGSSVSGLGTAALKKRSQSEKSPISTTSPT